MSLENRVGVISGATGGLGRVVARSLAGQGARLALFGTHADRLDQLARELALPGERQLTHALDLGDPQAGQAAAEAVRRKFGRADLLIHLIGGWAGGKPVVEVAPDDVAAMLKQHLWTTLYLAQAFVPLLTANGWGRVIVVSSPHAVRPPANGAPYAIGKAAQEALVLTLAEELRGSGVTANILQVQAIDVRHERDRAPTVRNASPGQPTRAGWTTPEEIAAAILYLCSDEARVISGARIPLHG